jgi:urocanate hydratase
LIERNIIPDTLTDQTSAHDPISYWPHEISYAQAKVLREKNPEEYLIMLIEVCTSMLKFMLEIKDEGAVTFIMEINKSPCFREEV